MRHTRRNTPRRSLGLACVALLLVVSLAGAAAPRGYDQRPDVLEFIERMHREHGFATAELKRLFTQARYQPQVVAAMTRPIVAPPTYDDFAPRFLSAARIEAGAEFWKAHAGALERASRAFGVP